MDQNKLIRQGSKWRAFLYRRLARWITCEVHLLGKHPLALDNKFQVNSLQDVFFHPFYWQIFNFFAAPPKLVIDLGAHCAHFSMLVDVCFRTRFGDVGTDYVLIEPNPQLIPVITRNLACSGLCTKNLVRQGLVGGARTGRGTLWVCPNNYLSASLSWAPATRPVEVDYVDLEPIVGDRNVDLLKVDIEGAEYDLVESYSRLFDRVHTVVMEIHQAPEGRQKKLRDRLNTSGLRPCAKEVNNGAYCLAMFRREEA